MSVRRAQAPWLIAGLALLSGGLWGCQSTQRQSGSEPATRPAETDARMENVLTDADTERAKAALERDWPSGERRPAVPGRRPVVDQPRAGRR